MKNRNRDINIYDVAKASGVSTTTVSRALKDHHSIGKETKKKVKKMALAMGYEPNVIASGLRNKKTHTIGVLVSYVNRPFISSFISGIEEVASKNNYHVIISQSYDSYEKEIENLKTLYNIRVDGLIVSLAMETKDYTHFDPFLQKNYPFVFADRVAYEMETDKVLIDNFNAAYEATTHLIERGYKRIGHLAGAQHRHVYRKRLEGYLAALNSHGLQSEERLIYYSNLKHEDGREGAKSLLNLTERPDAIFSANDTAAIGFMQYAEKYGLDIPNDLGVIGFNNDPISSIVKPQLSTIDHPAMDLGRKAAELVLDKISGKSHTTIAQTITFKTKLIARGSTMKE